jgi:hypothetical protein
MEVPFGPALKLSFYGGVHAESLPIEEGTIQDGGADEVGEALEAGLGGKESFLSRQGSVVI